MVHQIIDELLLAAHGTTAPSEDEWNCYLATRERHGIRHTLEVVLTHGGAPTPRQRRAFDERTLGLGVRTAVLSDSFAVRCALRVSTWFTDNQIHVLADAQVKDALAYLGVPASRVPLIEWEVYRLRRRLGERP